jgi:glycine/D-amino acid oxidase-like deaminating enzyme
MASFDYDVVIIGSGFGGSVAALRAAEKGYPTRPDSSPDARRRSYQTQSGRSIGRWYHHRRSNTIVRWSGRYSDPRFHLLPRRRCDSHRGDTWRTVSITIAAVC